MIRSLTATGAALAVVALVAPANAETAAPDLREAAFTTCAEAEAMPAEERTTLVLRIANAAAEYYQTQIAADEELGRQIGWLIRSACTIAPEGYLAPIVARAVHVIGGGEEPPLRQPLDMRQGVFLSCSGTIALPPEEMEQLGTFIGNEAAAHYGLTPGPDWTPDYVATLVHNGCQMYPNMHYLSIVGRAIRAVSGQTGTAREPVGRAR